jgi:hypothetical protein
MAASHRRSLWGRMLSFRSSNIESMNDSTIVQTPHQSQVQEGGADLLVDVSVPGPSDIIYNSPRNHATSRSNLTPRSADWCEERYVNVNASCSEIDLSPVTSQGIFSNIANRSSSSQIIWHHNETVQFKNDGSDSTRYKKVSLSLVHGLNS